MVKSDYKVEYHLICVIYFAESQPTGSDLAELWAVLGDLGERPADISYMFAGDRHVSNLGESKLGSPVLNQILGKDADKLQSIGADCIRRNARDAILDSDFNFGFSRNDTWNGEPVPAKVEFSISGQMLEDVGSSVVLDVLKRFFEVADRRSPICGLVDLAQPTDAFAGSVFGAAWPSRAPLARWIEHIGWNQSGARKGDRLRRLCWGNFLGTKILERLGGGTKFSEDFASVARNYDGSTNANIWLMTSGVFVSLCIDPLDCKPSNPTGILVHQANLEWLIRELGTNGVLSHW